MVVIEFVVRQVVVVVGGGEGGGALFSGEGPSPLFLLDFAGISQRWLRDSLWPYMCCPSNDSKQFQSVDADSFVAFFPFSMY